MKKRFLELLSIILPIAKYQIKENSMTPLFKPDDEVLLNKLSYIFTEPKIGDVIIFKNNDNKHLIKKIAEIKENKYYVLGLNKKLSIDSRHFGSITKDKIIGKVIHKLK